MSTIALLGALDTKGAEYQFVQERIHARGHRTLVIDIGVLGPPLIRPDISRDEVALAAGGNLNRAREKRDEARRWPS